MDKKLSDLARVDHNQDYLSGLNEAQWQAVTHIHGPLLVLAGAGTGKTRVLTTRIAHILHEGAARDYEILAVTFTNKAAFEMKMRIDKLLGRESALQWLGTFHAIGNKLLRRHAELVGLRPNFTILDTDDQIRLIKPLLRAHNIDEKKWPARMMAGLIDRWKNRALSPNALDVFEQAQFNQMGAKIYAEYQERLRILNAVDFGDLILLPIRIFRENPEVLADYHRRFRFLLVDEYQDTNVAQYLWLRLLAQGTGNICCVGDDDQSIYGWRGAEVGNILRFESDFPSAQIIRLEENYRSTPQILAAASALIAGNQSRLGKTLWTNSDDGEKLRLVGHWDSEEEARWISDDIEALNAGVRSGEKHSLEDMAILVRASHQMRAFEDRFLAIGLPYRVIGGPRFYERKEIRDAMAYFRLVHSQADDLAFERIINLPKRGIGEKALQNIRYFARINGVSLFEATKSMVQAEEFKGKSRVAMHEFVQIIERFSLQNQSGDNHIELAGALLDETGYTQMWQEDKSPDAQGRLDSLKELVEALENFENLGGFLEHVALVMENNASDSDEKVSIMTLHGSKGLEFPIVYLPGWEEGLFPSQRSMDEGGVTALEEERRLAYVGITRAERSLVISFAANRRIFNQWQNSMPSRFIDELPVDHVDVVSAGGAYGGSGKVVISDLETQAANADVYNAPGWARMQKQIRKPQAHYIQNSGKEFALGQRVFHQKFGYGYIIETEGDKCLVNFETSGEKRLMAQYLTAQDDNAD